MSTWIRSGTALLALLLATGWVEGASWADAMFEELSKDFGSVPRGPMLTHHFRVKNNTGRPVTISNVRVSCGCVSAAALQNYLQPGEETSIRAQMDTTRFVGVKNVTIYVQISEPAFEEVRLWVQANGRNDFAVSPDSLRYGVVKRDSEPTASVAVVFYGRGDARITEVKPESNYVLPRVSEVRRTDTEVVYQLDATMRRDVPVGKWYSDVWLSTSLSEMPRIRVPLTIEIESPLSISPQTLVIGPLKVNEPGERRLIVRGVKPFKIVGIEGATSAITVRESSPVLRPVHVLTVRVQSDRPGEWQRRLRVVTDLQAEREIDFFLQARIVP